MKYIIKRKRADYGNFYVTKLLNSVVDRIIEKYPTHEFEEFEDKKHSNQGIGTISSPLSFSIWNSSNNKYLVVSCIDNWKMHFMPHLGWKPEKMVKMFYSGGFNYLDYYSFISETKQPIKENFYQPFYYGPYQYNEQQLITDLFNSRKNPEKQELVFRGFLFPFRKTLVEKIDEEEIKIFDRRQGKESNLDYGLYLKELSKYTAALSLPGASEICNRDIECFAVGTPVIRPLIHTHYEDPLIPDYHYINCYVDCKYYSGNPGYNNLEDFGKYLKQTWNMVKNKKDYLNFVSTNARNWYVKNCLIENNIEYLINRIKLEDLNG